MWFNRPDVQHRWTYVVICLASVVEFIVALRGTHVTAEIAGLAVTAGGAGLAWWHPGTGLAAAAAGTVLSATLGGNPVGLWTITVFALFSIVLRWGHAVRSTTLAGLALYVAAAIGANYDFRSLPAFTAVFTAIAGGAVGAALRIHQRYWWSLEQRAKDAVATRESEGTRRVVEERLRIARDLHDVVGHEIAVVNMHLGVAEVNLPADAAQSRTSVEAARSAVRSVLTETQRILLVLRRESVEHDDAGQPTPQADRLPELIESYRSIGLRVTAELGELPAQLDPAVGVTAFRIMQEALTNAHRYGDGSVSVTVKVSDERVLIDVVNPRRQLGVEQSQGGGHGLLGVRERVASAGGMLTVSDDDPGEFGLHVALAIDGSDLYDRRLHRR